MNNQKGFTNIILIVIIIVLVGAVGYFYFVKKSEPVVQQPTPIQTQSSKSPTPTPTPQQNSKIETSSWKFWRTSKDHFLVKVPSDWKVSQADAGGFSLVSISASNNSGTNPNLTVSLESATDFLGENRTAFTTYVGNGGSKDSKSKPSISLYKNISLGGLSAVSQVENGITTAYYADIGSDTYLGIKYSINDPQKSILEVMVTTFNFKPTQVQLQGVAIIP